MRGRRVTGPRIVSVQKIWSRGDHCAFTDLARFRGKWFCTFREAGAHAGAAGKVRVIESADAASWRTAALFSEAGVDLRDPKLSVTPEGRLMLLMGGTPAGAASGGRQPRVAFSADGRAWTRPRRILDDGDWLWRVTWFHSRAYGVSYRVENDRTWTVALYESNDGLEYRLVCPLGVTGKPSEATIRFSPGGEALMLVRREGGDASAWIGSARAPFTKWSWKQAGLRVGGPNFITVPSGTWAACRDYDDDAGPVTVIARMGRSSLRPVLILPSGGDCSYPGLVWHGGLLWVSYYSSHGGKASIYLARVRLPPVGAKRKI